MFFLASKANPKRKLSSRKRRIVPIKSGEGTPGCGDRRWERWSMPLHSILEQPCAWADLDAWSAKYNLPLSTTRHLIAWLEMHGKIEFDKATKTWQRKEQS